MVLMAVGEDDADQVAAPFLDELEVGEDEVDARIIGVGESRPRSAIGHLPRQP